MNCDKCQELISDWLDGSLSRENEALLSSHLEACFECVEVQNDLRAIVSFCEANRGQYEAPPNPQALWLRIRNMVEADSVATVPAVAQAARKPGWTNWLGRSWELSLPQMGAAVAAIVLIVSLTTVVGLRRWTSPSVNDTVSGSRNFMSVSATRVQDRLRQQQQMIDYWNQRVEVNKARWSPRMRATFDRNLKVIDDAVNTSLSELSKNPHDEVSEEMLNSALNEKLAILKEFADL